MKKVVIMVVGILVILVVTVGILCGMSKPVYGYEIERHVQSADHRTAEPPPNPRLRSTTDGTLPKGCTISADTGTMTWTPDASELGIWRFRVTATDPQGASASQDFSVTVWATTDVNGDYYVNILDFIRVGQHFGQSGAPGWIGEDVNQDGTINILDLIDVAQDII